MRNECDACRDGQGKITPAEWVSNRKPSPEKLCNSCYQSTLKYYKDFTRKTTKEGKNENSNR